MKRNRNSICLLLLLLLALAPGCKKKEQPAPTPEPKPAPAPKGPQAAPVQKQLSSAGAQPGARLDFSKKTDPFKPYAPAAPAPVATPAQQAPRPTADLLPIQSFEVSKFKLAGIIAGINQNRALLIDPNGKGYVVQEGMQIGSNEGSITRITSNSVEVTERFREDNGRIRKRKIVLTLAKKR